MGKSALRKIQIVMIACLIVVALGAVVFGIVGRPPETSQANPTAGTPPAVSVRMFYVAPDGSDNNDGSPASPWQTLDHAFGQLSAGDVLNLRGGTYHERELTVSLQGGASNPIVIQSYPGERATIDGAVPDFESAPNSEWDLVDGSIQLYRSKQTFSGSLIRAWLVADDTQLVEYSAAANLESTNYGPVQGMNPLYIGPGLQLRSDGHIYIRLQSNPHDLSDASGKPVRPIPVDTNPNHNAIAVFDAEHIFQLEGAAFLHFKNIDFSYAQRIMDVRNGTHAIELDGCRLNFGTYGLVIRSGIHDWSIHDSEFNNGLAAFVYWTDVKNGDKEVAEAYPEFQSAGIIGSLPRFQIERNLFRNTFDALDIQDGTVDTRIADNTFEYVHDDVMELTRGVGNVEIARNLLWHVGSGISIDPSDAPPGNVYIHHNIIDNSALEHGGRPGNYRASDWPVWTTIDPFSSHDDGNKAAWWKIYNNTIVTRRSGYAWNGSGPDEVTGNPEKFLYNNVVYILDDRVAFRDDQASAGSHYDGNVYYRRTQGRYPLLLNFGNARDYNSLADFRAQSGTDWERAGLAVDPGFNPALLADPQFDAATIWNRYRPTNGLVFTPGASYGGLNWPGTAGVNYRGALTPTMALQVPPVYVPFVGH